MLWKTIKGIPRVVWLMACLYALVFSALSIYQYTQFMYSGFDLGIFHQVIWNTAHGRWFAYSFNPYSYLVDHREWLIVLFAGVYKVIAHPFLLLIAQSVALGAGALAVYCIALRIAGVGHKTQALVWSLVYLLHPTLHAMNLFEFHMMIFALPTSLWLWYAFDTQRRGVAVVLWIALLLLRDDLALMLIGVGVLFFLQERHRPVSARYARLWLGMSVVSVAWFVAMQQVGVQLSIDTTPKFFMFYDWMGESLGEAVRFILTHPLRVLQVVFRPDHVLTYLFIILTALGFPLLAPRYLIPVVLPMLTFVFIDRSIVSGVLMSHHGATWLPWVLIASMFGHQRLQQKGFLKRLSEMMKISTHALVLMAWCAVVIVGAVEIGPWRALASQQEALYAKDIASYREIIQYVGPTDAVMASSRLYTLLAEREQIYPTLTLWNGKAHYSNQPYQPPEHVDWMILEQEEIVRLGIVFTAEERSLAWQRFQSLIDENGLELVFVNEDLVVYGKQQITQTVFLPVTPQDSPVTLKHQDSVLVDDVLLIHGGEIETIGEGTHLLRLSAETKEQQLEDYFLLMQWKDDDQQIVKETLISIGAAVFPTHAWTPGQRYLIQQPITPHTESIQLQITIGRVKQQPQRHMNDSSQVIIDPQHTASLTIPLE